MRLSSFIVGLSVAMSACGGPFGRAPLVLTEVPNGPTGQSLVTLGAERSGCEVRKGARSLRLECPDGELDVPTFPGPPTFAVRCVDDRLRDVARCTAVVRKLLLATEERAP